MSKERVNWHTIDCRYISEGIGDDYKTWKTAIAGKQASRVFIESPTGSGKTSFIIDKLLTYAIEERRSIIYICNRDALKQQLITSIRESSLNLKEYVHVNKQVTKFDYPNSNESIYIVNYQSLLNLENNLFHPLSNIYYIVMDEVHFFLDDALYNNNSDKIFWKILYFFNNMVQLFMSATILDFMNLYTLTYKLFLPSHPQPQIYYNIFYEFSIEYYINTYTTPKYNIVLYNNEDFLLKRISSSQDEKWLIFTTNLENGNKLRDEIKKHKKCYCINAKSKNTKRWENLTINKSFDCDVLISTKVLDNGVNIIDDKLKNIVLPFMYPTDFIQMIGRKRFTETSQYVNLYVRRLTSQEIRSRLMNINNSILKINAITTAKSMRKKISYIKNYWNSKSNSGFDFKYKEDELQITFNNFTIFKLCLEFEFYNYLEMSSNNPSAYFYLIRNWLGNNIKEFENISAYTTLPDFMKNQVGQPITDTENFYYNFMELYQVYCWKFASDNNMTISAYKSLVRLRQATGRHKATINECLKKINLPYIINKKNNNWIVTPIVTEE